MPNSSQIFQDFLDALDDANDRAGFLAVMTRTLAHLQLPAFAYIGFADGHHHEPPILSNYPAQWVAHYAEQRYDRHDAVLDSAQAEILPFAWGYADYLKRLEQAPRRIFDEAKEFGIQRGFTVPIHDGFGKLATLTFATDEKSADFLSHIDENRHLIHLIGLYFHSRARSKLQQAAKPGQPKLTPREAECLQWAAAGKTSYEIADILVLSRRTVVFHLENAKRKLGVVTLQQAIVEALLRGAIAL